MHAQQALKNHCEKNLIRFLIFINVYTYRMRRWQKGECWWITEKWDRHQKRRFL